MVTCEELYEVGSLSPRRGMARPRLRMEETASRGKGKVVPVLN